MPDKIITIETFQSDTSDVDDSMSEITDESENENVKEDKVKYKDISCNLQN